MFGTAKKQKATKSGCLENTLLYRNAMENQTLGACSGAILTKLLKYSGFFTYRAKG